MIENKQDCVFKTDSTIRSDNLTPYRYVWILNANIWIVTCISHTNEDVYRFSIGWLSCVGVSNQKHDACFTYFTNSTCSTWCYIYTCSWRKKTKFYPTDKQEQSFAKVKANSDLDSNHVAAWYNVAIAIQDFKLNDGSLAQRENSVAYEIFLFDGNKCIRGCPEGFLILKIISSS